MCCLFRAAAVHLEEPGHSLVRNLFWHRKQLKILLRVTPMHAKHTAINDMGLLELVLGIILI